LIIHRAWQPPGHKLSFSPQHGEAFRAWLANPIGKRFLDLECGRLNEIVPTLFGYIAVTVGEPDFMACIDQSAIKKRFLLNDDISLVYAPNSLSLACSRQDSLALESGTVDLVYLAHTLEFASNPHEVLREAYRILRPDGHLIITMFNPLSVWGLWRSVAKVTKHVPWQANFMSVLKLKDWLALLGFDIMRINYFGFNLPVGYCSHHHKLSLCERWGQKLELPIGAAYIIEASKRVIPITPIVAPAWKAKPDIIADDITEPTT